MKDSGCKNTSIFQLSRVIDGGNMSTKKAMTCRKSKKHFITSDCIEYTFSRFGVELTKYMYTLNVHFESSVGTTLPTSRERNSASIRKKEKFELTKRVIKNEIS